MPSDLWLNGQQYHHQQLLNLDIKEEIFSPIESSVIGFYKQWHTGISEFTFQTSGTTGPPKIISFKREHLIHSAETTINALKLKKGMASLLCLNPDFVAGKMMMVRTFTAEMQLLAIDPSENPLININVKVDFIAITPQQLFTILDNEETYIKLQQISKVIVGGGPISDELANKLKEFKSDIFHSYAMTETLTHIALRKISSPKPQINYTLLPGFKIKPNARNCLMIKTPYNTDWIITNDLVKMNSQYSFQWLGRMDNVINSGGIKIIPEEIEPKIAKYFSQINIKNRFFLYGIKDEKLGEKLVILIEGTFSTDVNELLDNLKSILPKYKSPKNVILLPHFEMTTTGKINRGITMGKYLN